MALTKVTYSMIKGAAFSVIDYGATGDGTTDDTAAIQLASAALQANGGGTLYFPSGTYKVYSTGITTSLADFSSLDGVSVVYDNAEIVVDRTFTGSTTLYAFKFSACNNVYIQNTKISCTQTQPVGQKTARGVYVYRFLQGCQNITAVNTYASSMRVVWDFHREPADPVSYVSHNINLGETYAVDTGYPLLGSLSGYSLEATLQTLRCGRSYFFTGASGHKVLVNSTNHEASVDCLLATDAGQGMYDVDLKYINLASTTNDTSVNCVRVEYQDGQTYNGTFRNIKVDFDIQTNAGVSALGYAFSIDKVANDVPDPTDRGHILDGVTLSGNIINPSGRSFNLLGVGTWGSGEYVRNIKIDNLRCATGTTVNMNLSSLKDVATIQNFVSSTALEDTNNTSGKVVYINCNVNGSMTSSTADNSIVDYYSCNIQSATNQSVLNKAFYNTTVGSEVKTFFRGTYNIQSPLAAGSVLSLTPPDNSADVAGILDVVDGNGYMARFSLTGANHTTIEVSDPSTKYSNTAGSAFINVYWSAGNSRYEIQNGTASGNSVRICLTYFSA